MREFLGRHFEMPGARGRLASMEGMRGLAALLVFFVHFNALFHRHLIPGSALSRAANVAGTIGHTGVDVFFVLSGYLIYGIVMRKNFRFPEFVYHRARRLYPTFLVILSAYVALSAVFQDFSKFPPALGDRIAYLMANLAMLPGMTSIRPIVTVSWSLSYEWFFYLAMPFAIWALQMRRWRGWQRILFFFVLSMGLISIPSTGHAAPVRMAMFGSGIIVWELVSQYGLASRLTGWGEYAAIGAFATNLGVIGVTGSRSGIEDIVMLTRVPQFYPGSLFVTVALLTLYGLFYDGLLKKFFTWDYLRWMGNISYSYYLIHGLAMHGIRIALKLLFPIFPSSTIFCLGLLAACVAITLMCGAALFLLIEKPLLLQRTRMLEWDVRKGPRVFYRVRRNLNYLRFHLQTRRLLDTPPLVRKDAPLTIVSMVAGYDVRLYILAMKALYRRVGSGKIVAIIASDVSRQSQDLIQKHLGPVEFVPITSIDTGKCQRGGTWERLIYCVERSAREYVVQMDCDALCVGPIPEVLECIQRNRGFLLADGIPKKPLVEWVREAEIRNSENVVFAFERRAREFPDAGKWQYLRGSSGFAGFPKGSISREFIEEFHQAGEKTLGSRWEEWGTEQIASNFAIANAPGSVGLPKPKYLSYENHEIPEEISLLHFLGYCRFNHGVFAEFANREIDALLGRAPAFAKHAAMGAQ